ncbi:MAG: hypothetical protein IPH43_03515 [Xanthomonadales bacterium]|nr:hypothetical protein [Xanthomonadales bacterium]
MPIVADEQAHDQVIAFGKSRGGEIEVVAVAPMPWIVTGFRAQAFAVLADRDLFAAALGKGDGKLGIGDAVVIGNFEIKRPLALPGVKLGQGFLGRDDLDLGNLVDDGIEAVLAVLGQR